MHTRRGDLGTYPDQASVFATKGFSLCMGSFKRGKSVGHSGKHAVKVARDAMGAISGISLKHPRRRPGGPSLIDSEDTEDGRMVHNQMAPSAKRT